MRFSLVVAMTSIVAQPAAADDIFARYFGGARPCYARIYDDAHLRAHPKQTVRRITIDYDRAEQEKPEGPDAAKKFNAGIGFVLKRSPERYGQELYCTNTGSRFDCYLDADGGRIRLTPAGKGLRLDVVSRGPDDAIAAEGAKDFGSFGKPKGDDRVFLLAPADPKVCARG